MPRIFILVVFISFQSSLLCAARFYLRDGTVVEAAFIGEANGEVVVLDALGKKQKLVRAEIRWVDWEHRLKSTLEARAKRRRESFSRKRRAEAERLVRKLERCRASERAKIFQALDGFQDRELLSVFDRGLRSQVVEVREYTCSRLERFHGNAAVVPLVSVATTHRDPELVERVHQLALSKDADMTRKLYEYVVVTAPVPQRLRALDSIQKIGDLKSATRLVWNLTYVQSHIRAQLARSRGLREVPVRLGQNTDVSIELPEIELIEVMTTVQIPVESLKTIEAKTVEALEAISGQQLGSDSRSWQHWLKQLPRPKSPMTAPTSRPKKESERGDG